MTARWRAARTSKTCVIDEAVWRWAGCGGVRWGAVCEKLARVEIMWGALRPPLTHAGVQANQLLRKASEHATSYRMFMMLFMLFASFVLLFLDWYQ